MMYSLFKIYLTLKAPITTAADDTFFNLSEIKISLIFHVNNLIRRLFTWNVDLIFIEKK